jgi:hypothetical protein
MIEINIGKVTVSFLTSLNYYKDLKKLIISILIHSKPLKINN